MSISDLIDVFISKKTKMNNNTNKIMLEINKYWRVCWFKFIKLLSINVKNVKKPVNNVMRNKIMIVIFFFKKPVVENIRINPQMDLEIKTTVRSDLDE